MPRELKLKTSFDGIERWMDEKGPGGRSFRESLEAGGVIAEDLLVVAGAINGLLASGLTRGALHILIQAKAKKRPNGDPIALSTISDVLDAMANLHTFLEAPPAKATAR